MKNYNWMKEVLQDLNNFARANGLTALACDLEAALRSIEIYAEGIDDQVSRAMPRGNVYVLSSPRQKHDC